MTRIRRSRSGTPSSALLSALVSSGSTTNSSRRRTPSLHRRCAVAFPVDEAALHSNATIPFGASFSRGRAQKTEGNRGVEANQNKTYGSSSSTLINGYFPQALVTIDPTTDDDDDELAVSLSLSFSSSLLEGSKHSRTEWGNPTIVVRASHTNPGRSGTIDAVSVASKGCHWRAAKNSPDCVTVATVGRNDGSSLLPLSWMFPNRGGRAPERYR
mmetsp:Transcript_4692/g.13541  ORF Transcript_4692/g.13541 Transcript_4692/m.13541 type:complete len:214 (+) Transcript_4692:1035-1676(+)